MHFARANGGSGKRSTDEGCAAPVSAYELSGRRRTLCQLRVTARQLRGVAPASLATHTPEGLRQTLAEAWDRLRTFGGQQLAAALAAEQQ